MAYINDNFLKLQAGYLFPEIGRRVAAFAAANPDKASQVIRCGIGDVTEPLPMAAIEAMHKAVDDQAQRETFHGYAPVARALKVAVQRDVRHLVLPGSKGTL